MKMTRLEWRYLQRIALDHPYFDTHKLPLTEKEAKAIVEANNRMTGKEFVDSIYAKLGMTRPQERKKHFAWLRNFGELFTVPPIRKIAIAILVVVLMTVFFTATPTGRAIAESVIEYIATLLEDGKLVVNRNDNAIPPHSTSSEDSTDNDLQDPNDITACIVQVNSFDEFIMATGKTPMILPLPCVELYYVYDEEIDYLDLNAVYEAANGKIITCQIWNVEETESISSTGYNVYDSNDSIYYSIEEGSIYLQRIMEDSILTITSTGSYSLDDIIIMLKTDDKGGR